MQLTVDPHGRVMKPVRLWDISASLTQMEARCLYIMTGEAADAVIREGTVEWDAQNSCVNWRYALNNCNLTFTFSAQLQPRAHS